MMEYRYLGRTGVQIWKLMQAIMLSGTWDYVRFVSEQSRYNLLN